MNISEQDEIILKYSNHLEQNNLQKVAFDWIGLAQGLGIDALLGGGIGAGMAAYKGTSILSGLLAGAFGLGAGPVAAVLLSAGVAAAVWAAAQRTDDNIDDLLDRLEDLDPNKDAKNIIENNWKPTLQKYTSLSEVQSTASDPRERAEQLKQKIEGLDDILKFLNQMNTDWPKVKSNLEDIGFDRMEFEKALGKTMRALANDLTAIKQEAQKEGAKLINELGKQSGVNYEDIAKKVMELHNQIIQLSGNTPEYEEHEKPAFSLAQNILSNKARLDEIHTFGPQMKGLARDLENILNVVKRKGRKAIKEIPAISKRAVKLKGITDTKTAPGVKSSPGSQSPSAPEQAKQTVKNPEIVFLQKSINYLNLNLKTGVSRVAEDGTYGETTAKALYDFFEKMPLAEEHLMRRVGIDKQNVLDLNFMKDNPDYLAGLVKVIGMFVNQIYSTIEPEKEQAQQQSKYDAGVVQCDETKENPKPAEILACLRARQIRDPKTEQVFTAYEFLKQKGMRDNDIAALINHLFGGWRSEDWDMKLLVRYVSGPRFSVLRGY